MGALVFLAVAVASVVDILLAVDFEAAQLHRLSAEIAATFLFQHFHTASNEMFVFKSINSINYAYKSTEYLK